MPSDPLVGGYNPLKQGRRFTVYRPEFFATFHAQLVTSTSVQPYRHYNTTIYPYYWRIHIFSTEILSIRFLVSYPLFLSKTYGTVKSQKPKKRKESSRAQPGLATLLPLPVQ
jgi:hypothetical protein